MKYSLIFLCFVVCAFAAMEDWEGTFTSNKRNVGGLFYICVDPATGSAEGVYGGAGKIYAEVTETTMVGNWYEAGYDGAYGAFILTLTSGGFEGTWSYHGDPDATLYDWTGDKQDGAEPTDYQCLLGVAGTSHALGTYRNGAQVCQFPKEHYQNSHYKLVAADFPNAGTLMGYTVDDATIFISDFRIFDDDHDDFWAFKPETNERPLGIDYPVYYDLSNDDDYGLDDDEDIGTRYIFIGAQINSKLCGHLWRGLYNLYTGFKCTEQSNHAAPLAEQCLNDFRREHGVRQDNGINDAVSELVNRKIDEAIYWIEAEFPTVNVHGGRVFRDQDDDGSVTEILHMDDNDPLEYYKEMPGQQFAKIQENSASTFSPIFALLAFFLAFIFMF